MSTTADRPTSGPVSGSVPAEYVGLVDDAAMFPPGDAPLGDAVEGFVSRGALPWAAFVGRFVIGDRALPGLRDAGLAGGPPVPVTVVVSTGAGGLEPAARLAQSIPGVELAAMEIALRDLDDLPAAARRVAAAAYDLPEVPVYVELPRLGPDGTPAHGWSAALDELATADLRAKLRLGGVTADLVPSVAAVAGAIEEVLDRELAFKCTAGLHHAVRRWDESLGTAQHGFLNVLLATRAALDGGGVAAALAEEDPAAVVAAVRAHGPAALSRTRRWFTSFGCCDVEDPWSDLVDLHLV